MSDENNSRVDRPKFQGNWKCSQCATDITELPFEPDPARESQLLCLDCHKQKMADRPRRNDFQRRKYQGNWKCSQCRTAITELPFQPTPGREDTLMCRDCYKK
ncbi:hypothetical protein KKB69_01435 [Patescibacteria group bacterium]|nr:hypothetical protein [Patescibacteria group bacterium]